MSKFNRRAVLGAGLGVGAAAALSGCNLIGGKEEEPAPRSSGSGGSSGGSVTIGIVPDPAGASQWYAAQFKSFTEQTGITVKVIEYPSAQIRNALELAYQSGDAPDVVRAQGTAAVQAFDSRGWLADLTEYADQDVIDRLGGADAMNPQTSGLHFGGKLLSLPLVSRKWVNGPLMYNTDIFSKVGLDAPPATWSEFEQFARDITEAGKGDFYGFSPGSDTAGEYKWLQAQASPNSIQRYNLNLITGEAAEADEQNVAAVELYRTLHADKIFEPGWESWEGTRIAQEFAKGKLGMAMVGNWLVGESVKLNPAIEEHIGIADIPVPDSGRAGYFAQAPFQPIWSMSADAKDKDASWELMKFMISDEFQRGYFEEFRSFTAVESAWQQADQTDIEKAQSAVLDNQLAAPDLRLGNEAQYEIITALTAEQAINDADGAPQAITRNQDFRPMAEARDKMREELIDKTIDDLNDKGIKASRDDLVFADWDPMTDWTPA